MARRIERESLAYIDCEVPQEMTLREWRCAPKPAAEAERPRRVRSAAAALGRATRLRKRVD
jgi:hypothetical protein